MKKFAIFITLALATAVSAQEAEKKTVSTYYRNALTNMMVYHVEDEFGYDVYTIFSELPPEDKYDNHDVDLHVIDNAQITGVARRKGIGLHRQTYGGDIILTKEEKQANGEAMLDLLNRAEIGKRIVAKWFNLQGETLQDAHFGTDCIEERSHYNASQLEIEKARYTIQGLSALQDVSSELINHSFVLVSDMTYITAEDRAATAKATLGVIGAVFDAFAGGNSGQRLAETAGDIADKFTGFKVMTHSYLYQLVWNDSIANIFYQNYYTSEPDPARIQAFLADETSFQLQYLGTESANYEKTKLVGKYSRSELLQMITVRSIDNNIAKLQKRFEAFRVKAPITAVEYDKKGQPVGYRAQIGEKEGVEDNMKFEVLEARYNKGRIEYHRVGILKPVRNHIWDNRFNALIENDSDGELQGTLFKLDSKSAGHEILPGMLIRQING
jgi:hypothetical protein